MKRTLRQFGEKASLFTQAGLNLCFPPRCMACGVGVDAPHSFCTSCFDTIRFIEAPMCQLCGFPFEYDLGQEVLCGHCMHDVPPYDEARAVFHYDETTRHLITRFKYSDRTERMPGYARLMARAGAGLLKKSDVIIPVPLHRKRMMQRKYNQSALLAYGLADTASLPVLPDGLLRTKHTPPQAGLTRKQRQENVKGVFKVNHRYAKYLRGKSVLLIDDVMTTGATIQACTKMLLGAGVAHVYVLCLARTVKE